MTRPNMNLQDSFLNQARRDNLALGVQLVNGTRLEGRVTGFDNFTLIVDDGKRRHLVYKHAIALISPSKKAGPRGDRTSEKTQTREGDRKEREKGPAESKVFNDSLRQGLQEHGEEKKP